MVYVSLFCVYENNPSIKHNLPVTGAVPHNLPYLAEGEGFEPSNVFKRQQFSRLCPRPTGPLPYYT